MIKRSSLSTLAISSILLLFVIATGAQTEYDYITSGNAHAGDIVPCRITDSSDYDLIAEMVEE